MLFLDDFQKNYIMPALLSSYYKDWLKTYSELFEYSRKQEHRANNKDLLSLQVTIADLETKMWEKIREGKEIIKELSKKSTLSEQEKKDLEGTQTHLFIHKELIRIGHIILDGVAWRTLNHNRFLLHTMARGYGTGAINANSLEYTRSMGWAFGMSEKLHSTVLVNDLTRFLRVGDLTEINGDSVIVHELKRQGKEIRNFITLRDQPKGWKWSGQTKRLMEFQRLAVTNEMITKEGKVKANIINVKSKTHTEKIKNLLQISEKETAVQKLIEPYLFVSVMNFIQKKSVEVFKEKFLFFNKEIWSKDSKVLLNSSWDSFHYDERGNFMRSVSPYSVFSLSNKYCMALMSGEILLKTEINIDILTNLLRQNGWNVIDREIGKSKEDFEKETAHIFDTDRSLYDLGPDYFLFTVQRGPFRLNIPGAWIMRLSLEFLTFDTLLKTLEYVYEETAKKQQGGLEFLMYRNEKDLWN